MKKTQTQLAGELGVHQSQVSRWLKGETPRLETARRVAPLLGIAWTTLLKNPSRYIGRALGGK